MRIDLSGNRLEGSIPGLADNNLTGSIPSSLGQLERLERLDLGKLQNLYNLNLASNELTGTIPAFIPSLKRLEDLALGSNRFTGEVPSNISALEKLIFLRLESNELTGTIPTSLSGLKNLISVSLFNNKMRGEIPIFFQASVRIRPCKNRNPILIAFFNTCSSSHFREQKPAIQLFLRLHPQMNVATLQMNCFRPEDIVNQVFGTPQRSDAECIEFLGSLPSPGVAPGAKATVGTTSPTGTAGSSGSGGLRGWAVAMGVSVVTAAVMGALV
ncbi:hypothetical protein BC829DRAFT_402937 [Chytridium lagenaria]|nr:hypothetical protein BC829DRAFT_402937 [Chytridium lagenaria]